MADQQKVLYDLSNGTIFSDLEQPLTQFFKVTQFFELNISQTAKDTATFAEKQEQESVLKIPNNLE